jgi:glycosyltransferase involved in cell wall biosynthesis
MDFNPFLAKPMFEPGHNIDRVASDAEDLVQFSLVVATLGRTTELSRLLQTLADQTHQSFEVIVVDQNAPGYLDETLRSFEGRLTIHHLPSERKGACTARNRGADLAKGTWVMFPDDDCWYPPGMLARAAAAVSSGDLDFFCGRAAGPEGQAVFSLYTQGAARIGRHNVWSTSIEWMAAIRRDLFLKVGGFDEKLGPGSGTPFGAYEINDLVLALLNAGGVGQYDPDWYGYHDFQLDSLGSPDSITKMHHYARGMGYVVRKHRLGAYHLGKVAHRSAIGIAYFLARGNLGRARRSYAIVAGILSGWLQAGDSLAL